MFANCLIKLAGASIEGALLVAPPSFRKLHTEAPDWFIIRDMKNNKFGKFFDELRLLRGLRPLRLFRLLSLLRLKRILDKKQFILDILVTYDISDL
jgi:hypothetical protein